MLKFLLIQLIVLWPFIPYAQRNTLSFGAGYSFNFKRDAQGYGLGAIYTHNIKSKHAFGLEIFHLFQHSSHNLPVDFAAKNFVLRTSTNPDPFHSPLPTSWTNGFYGWHLKSKPNRFFNGYAGLAYQFKMINSGKHRIDFNIGSGLHFRDETEILKIEQIKFNPPVNTIETYYWPIFRYNTFLDASMIGGINYHRQLKETLFIGLVNRVVYFPKSKQGLLSLNVMITKQF